MVYSVYYNMASPSNQKKHSGYSNTKGSLYTLESAIAIIIMITTVLMLLRQPSESQELDIANYKLNVYNALKISSEVGNLRRYALSNDTTSIKSEIGSNIPAQLEYDVAIYNKTSALTSEPSVNFENVITVSYFLAGSVGNYNPREVKVFVWGMD
jgi:hypothetical protein